MSDNFEAIVRRSEKLPIIQFKGDLTTFAEDVLQNSFHMASQDNKRVLAMDFSTCEYINSAGIAVVIGMVTESKRIGQRIFVFGLSPHYQKIFRMVGLADYVEICTSEQEALDRVG